MRYSSFEPRVLPIFIFYFALIIAGIVVTYKLIKKYNERQQKPALHLAIVYAFFTSAIIVLTIGLAEAAITGYYKEIYRFSLPLAYSLVVIADIFLFYFASNITDQWKNLFLPLVIAGVLLIVVIFLPWNYWGYPRELYEGKLNIRLYTNIGFISYSYLVYFLIIWICIKSRKKTSDEITRLGLKLLMYSMVAMILFFVMVLADNIMIVVFNHPGYSEFQFASWIFALIFVILTYFSLIMPKWLVDRIKK
ncbi:MAG: hypothetical protein EU539_04425 [Promethearchaeota archaeon]|nr:MAG: hypothetical protein EU539_04425 [Candidatus Lokiarchaeota archaeon]